MSKYLQYTRPASEDVSHVLNIMGAVHPIDSELIEEFDRHLLRLRIKKDQILFNENEVCEYMYFIIKGALRGCTTHNKQKITTYISVENDFVSSISGLHGLGYSQEYVVAVEDTDLLAIHNNELNRLFAHHFELNYIFRVILEKYYKDAQQRAHIIRVGNAKERYLYFAKTNPGYLDRLPLELVASLLNVKASTLLSIRKSFSKPKERSKDLAEFGRKLELQVNKHQLFRHKDIRLHALAQKIGLSSHELSVVLNSHFNKSFIDYINQYRVNWIKDSIRNPEIMQNFTLEALAYSAGFSSRSAFYNSFKKLVGMSPVEYSKNIEKQKS
ncbi:helix-turn-helix domain-containing protein [Pedobacter psychrodurus]|uniref:Helix-turn-helix domain-containing protein n=1 Tax=Pedobacter psychrodurus TaxID=2530456 RepID=A0A4R0Q6U0_9SPHI|nr:helix-turn-helix domain-containing protein [Pedobacter psychrodurus]TCD29010.1 helix-turn-helix domain-containing protein [Pedobacter psychrodurus]